MASMSEPITLQQLQDELAEATERFASQMRQILQEETRFHTWSRPQSRRDDTIPGHATRPSATESDGRERAFSWIDPHSGKKDDDSGDADKPGRGSHLRTGRKDLIEFGAHQYMLPEVGIHEAETARHEVVYDSWLHGKTFQKAMAIVVALNAVVTGLQIDYEAQHIVAPNELNLCDKLFACVFIIEIIMRLAIERWTFFYSKIWGMNMLDLSLVCLQCAEWAFARSSFVHVQTVRLFRLLRLSRLVRVFRAFDPMLAVISALASSVQALFWTLIVFVMIMYMSSAGILHMITHMEASDEPVVQRWFSSISHAMLSLIECISGGAEWDEIVRPLFVHVSPWVGVAALVYIISGNLFMLNLITGIFLDQVTRGAVEDRDQLIVQRITEHFLGDGNGDLSTQEAERQIEIEEFEGKLEHPIMQEYLSSLDVRPSQLHARKLFELLDKDNSGSISAEEVVHGCLALRGSAKGLDAQILLREVGELVNTVKAMKTHTSVTPELGPPLVTL